MATFTHAVTSLFAFIWCFVCQNSASEVYRLILNAKSDSYFTDPLLENSNDPNANTYSIIGTINETLSHWRATDNKYEFKLVYGYEDGSFDELIWKQSSWILEVNGTIVGFEEISIPNQIVSINNPAYFFSNNLFTNCNCCLL